MLPNVVGDAANEDQPSQAHQLPKHITVSHNILPLGLKGHLTMESVCTLYVRVLKKFLTLFKSLNYELSPEVQGNL